jgi:transcriptional antiterminator RfaH
MKTENNLQEKKEIKQHDGTTQEPFNKKWYVVITSPRAEKKAALELQEIGIEAYCPVSTHIRQWSDRKKKIEKPLISSIIFVRIEQNKRELVYQSRGVARYLYWLGRPAVVRDAEIETMQAWLKSDHLDPKVERLKPGDNISIHKGPFKGQKGIVQQTTNNSIQLILEEVGIKITISKPKE